MRVPNYRLVQLFVVSNGMTVFAKSMVAVSVLWILARGNSTGEFVASYWILSTGIGIPAGALSTLWFSDNAMLRWASLADAFKMLCLTTVAVWGFIRGSNPDIAVILALVIALSFADKVYSGIPFSVIKRFEANDGRVRELVSRRGIVVQVGALVGALLGGAVASHHLSDVLLWAGVLYLGSALIAYVASGSLEEPPGDAGHRIRGAAPLIGIRGILPLFRMVGGMALLVLTYNGLHQALNFFLPLLAVHLMPQSKWYYGVAEAAYAAGGIVGSSVIKGARWSELRWIALAVAAVALLFLSFSVLDRWFLILGVYLFGFIYQWRSLALVKLQDMAPKTMMSNATALVSWVNSWISLGLFGAFYWALGYRSLLTVVWVVGVTFTIIGGVFVWRTLSMTKPSSPLTTSN